MVEKLALPHDLSQRGFMSDKQDQDIPEDEPVGNPGAMESGGTSDPRPEEEPPEPSSPPCYLHEFPPPEATDTPPETKPVSELTPEEQMERFEKELKETDWGHQPC